MLYNYIPRQTYAIVSGYAGSELAAVVAGAELGSDYCIDLFFPKANPFVSGQKITLHLDNRSGIEQYDEHLRVYRTSVKAHIAESSEGKAHAIIDEYELVHSNSIVERYAQKGFKYDDDVRPVKGVPSDSELESVQFENEEFDNKLGVLVTRGCGSPHTTVMAFLSDSLDNIFLISPKNMRKAFNLERDNRCLFAIDHRANYQFEKAYEWNYTIISGEAFQIAAGTGIFDSIQREFVRKNPWELLFFSAPEIAMYHIRPGRIICPERYIK